MQFLCVFLFTDDSNADTAENDTVVAMYSGRKIFSNTLEHVYTFSIKTIVQQFLYRIDRDLYVELEYATSLLLLHMWIDSARALEKAKYIYKPERKESRKTNAKYNKVKAV